MPHSCSSFVLHTAGQLLCKLWHHSVIHITNFYCKLCITSGTVYIKRYETYTFTVAQCPYLLWSEALQQKINGVLGMHVSEPGLHTYPHLSPALPSKYPGYDFLIIYFGLRTQYFRIHWITLSIEIRLLLLNNTLGPLSIQTQEEGSLRQRNTSLPDYVSWKNVWGSSKEGQWALAISVTTAFLPQKQTTSINPLHFSHWADVKLK